MILMILIRKILEIIRMEINLLVRVGNGLHITGDSPGSLEDITVIDVDMDTADTEEEEDMEEEVMVIIMAEVRTEEDFEDLSMLATAIGEEDMEEEDFVEVHITEEEDMEEEDIITIVEGQDLEDLSTRVGS